MVAVILFLGFWVLVALSLIYVAIRGGLGGVRTSRPGQSRAGRRFASLMLLVIFVGFGILVPGLLLGGNHDRASAQVNGIKLTADEKRGRELFGVHCAVCHTLSEASATGKVGPNLDLLQPPASLVMRTINNGCAQSASGSSAEACLGYGTMPSDLVQGRDAQDVSDFVAKVAGK